MDSEQQLGALQKTESVEMTEEQIAAMCVFNRLNSSGRRFAVGFMEKLEKDFSEKSNVIQFPSHPQGLSVKRSPRPQR